MPRYLVQASYGPTAIAALVSNPVDRTAVLRQLVEKLGGKLESLEYCFGDYDVVGICTMPDDTAATAAALAACAPGHLKAYKTTRLMSAQDFLAALQKAHGTNYQAPKAG
jgi:uncharacterized protein with GYD domain